MTQLALFQPEAPIACAPVRRHQRDKSNDLIACPKIETELLEIFRARFDEWLDIRDFRSVVAKHRIGFGLGHKLFFMAQRGLLEEKKVYLGKGVEAHRPGSPDYQGFTIEYKLAQPAALEIT